MINRNIAAEIFKKTLTKHSQLNQMKELGKKDIPLLNDIITEYTKALELSPRQKSVLHNRGLAFATLAKIGLSFEKYEKSLELLDEAMNNFTLATICDKDFIHSYLHRAFANNAAHEIYKEMGRRDLALQHLLYVNDDYNTIYKITKDTKESYILDSLSKNMDKMAEIYKQMADYQKAIDSYRMSIKYAQKVLDIEPNDMDSLGNIATNKCEIAKLYLYMEQNSKAIILYNESIEEFKQFLAIYPKDIFALNHMAIVCTELANYYRYEMVRKKNQIFMIQAEFLYLESDRYYKKALNFNSNDMITFVNIAGNYSDIGKFYIYIKENSKAINFFNKSLNVLHQVLELDNKSPQAINNLDIAKLELAEAYKREGETDKAFKVLKSALQASDSKNSALIRAEIGRIYLIKGIKDKALHFFDDALKEYLLLLEKSQNDLVTLQNISMLLSNILKLSIDNYYVNKAIWCNQKIIEIYDRYFIDIGFEEDAFFVTEKMTVALKRLLDTYIKSNRKADSGVIEALEMIKAKRLQQLFIANLFQERESKLDAKNNIEVQQLKRKLNAIKQDIQREEINTFNIEEQKRLYEAFQNYSQQLSKLLNIHKDVDDIYNHLSLDEVIIYPIYYHKQLTIVTVRKIVGSVSVQIYQKEIKSDIRFTDYLLFIKYIERLIKDREIDTILPTEAIEKINNINIEDEIKEYMFNRGQSDQYLSFKIERWEFKEEYRYTIIQMALSHIKELIIQSIPKGIKKIFFASFGEINLLPLHAIPLKREEKYLINEYEISYIPSLALLYQFTKTPSYKSRDNLFVSLSKDDLYLEGEACKKIIGGELLRDIEVERFKNSINDKELNVIHLSTHGSANLSNPLDSKLEFFDHSRLSLFEIYGLKLKANLVNISACETYLSTLQGADEVHSFERAFLTVGAKSVISTFLKVDTDQTREFMESFYSGFDNNNSLSKIFQNSCKNDIENSSMEWSLFRFAGL